MICSVIEEPTTPLDGGPSACPFVAFEDDRDHRSTSPDYQHRCFAAPEPEPRAFPHQERYCLSADFARCPVFLDWARQEAAAVKVAGAAAAASTVGPVDDDVAAAVPAAADAAPAFLATRPRPTVSPDTLLPSPRKADASAGLWSYEGETKRSPAPSAPLPPSSLGPPAVAMARRGPSHPGWENPPRVESFPRLRSREDRRANQPLLFAAVGVALVMVALVVFPILTNRGGTTILGGSASPGAFGSGLSESAVPSATPVPTSAEPTFYSYIISAKDANLSVIAVKFNVALPILEAANPQLTNPNVIWPGMIIYIPPPGWRPSPSAVAPVATPVASPSAT
jgi:LysM repeat protein